MLALPSPVPSRRILPRSPVGDCTTQLHVLAEHVADSSIWEPPSEVWGKECDNTSIPRFAAWWDEGSGASKEDILSNWSQLCVAALLSKGNTRILCFCSKSKQNEMLVQKSKGRYVSKQGGITV